MKPQTTRTLNPLPFQDLEPHRFEDLVRQLAYDFRRWKRIEPLGRGGSDDGIDIRAVEEVISEESADVTDDEPGISPTKERVWIFQCKREKDIGPKKLREIVAESLRSLVTPPDGFVLAGACDFSKKARDAFREEMVASGVAEFALWGKADLEDMLFQSKNDHLLFIYFGLSLQPQRRSVRTFLRSLVATKKQIHSLFKGAYESSGRETHGSLALIRDPNDTCYPKESSDKEVPGWVPCRILGQDTPEGLLVLRREFVARVSGDGRVWDVWEGVDFAQDLFRADIDSAAHRHRERSVDSEKERVREWWSRYVPESEQAWLQIYRVIPWDRILAIDPHGDESNPVPHIYVDFVGENGPFLPGVLPVLRGLGSALTTRAYPYPSFETREAFFPSSVPKNVFPPPNEVVRSTPSTKPRLPKKIREELDGVLNTLSDRRVERKASPVGPSPQTVVAMERRKKFNMWIEEVAIPVFSGYVHALVSAGYEAWIMPKEQSVEDESDLHSDVRIELQMRIPEPLPHNRDYCRSCHLIYTLKHWGKIAVARYPSNSEEPSIQRTMSGEVDLDGLTEERVMADVLGILIEVSRKSFP